MPIFSDFFSAFMSADAERMEDLQAEVNQLHKLLEASYQEQRDLILENARGRARARAEIRAVKSEAEYLRGKLVELRPYLVAFAKGSSLQAKRDLAALDAALRATE